MLRTQDKRLFLGRELRDIGAHTFGPPVAGFNAWYDASYLPSLTVVSDALSQWDDLSENGYHLTQGTSGDRPAYGGGGARSINGIVVPEFVPGDHMTSSWPRDDRTSCTFVVGLTDTVAAGVRCMVGMSGSGGISFRASANDLQTTDHNSVWSELTNVVSASTAFVAVQNITDTGVTHYFNGSSEADANSETASGGRTAYVGANNPLGSLIEGWDGLIGEIIGYPFTLTADEVQAVMSYLQRKWDTP